MTDERTSLDAWRDLRLATPARIALGRSGSSLPTTPLLALALAHARARDAVHAPFDDDAIATRLADHGIETVRVRSRAGDRDVYLRRPDLGGRLDEDSRVRLAARATGVDVCIVVGDGLSATAAGAHGCELALAYMDRLATLRLEVAPVVLAIGARVALGDEIGETLGARLVAMLIGERPGLSAPDSLGAYLTYAPRLGRSDAERNCLSNIRDDGLRVAEAAHRMAWLTERAFAGSATGVTLKDESLPPAASITSAGTVGPGTRLPPS